MGGGGEYREGGVNKGLQARLPTYRPTGESTECGVETVVGFRQQGPAKGRGGTRGEEGGGTLATNLGWGQWGNTGIGANRAASRSPTSREKKPDSTLTAGRSSGAIAASEQGTVWVAMEGGD